MRLIKLLKKIVHSVQAIENEDRDFVILVILTILGLGTFFALMINLGITAHQLPQRRLILYIIMLVGYGFLFTRGMIIYIKAYKKTY